MLMPANNGQPKSVVLLQNWVFPYPTLLKEEALSELNEYAERVASFFSDHIDSDQLDKCGVMGEEIMQASFLFI